MVRWTGLVRRDGLAGLMREACSVTGCASRFAAMPYPRMTCGQFSKLWTTAGLTARECSRRLREAYAGLQGVSHSYLTRSSVRDKTVPLGRGGKFGKSPRIDSQPLTTIQDSDVGAVQPSQPFAGSPKVAWRHSGWSTQSSSLLASIRLIFLILKTQPRARASP